MRGAPGLRGEGSTRFALLLLALPLAACGPWRQLTDEETRWDLGEVYCTDAEPLFHLRDVDTVGPGSLRFYRSGRRVQPRGGPTWVAADGQIFSVDYEGKVDHFDGRSWSVLPIDSLERSVEAIWGTSAEHVYVVGAGRIHARDGDRFRSFDAGTWRHISAVWSSGRGDLWVAGQDGMVRVHDGREWVDRYTPSDGLLTGITGSGQDDVWTWTYDELYHWDGSAWTRVGGLEPPIVTVACGGPDEVFASDGEGVARRVDGGWDRIEPPTPYFHAESLCLTDRSLIARGGLDVFALRR